MKKLIGVLLAGVLYSACTEQLPSGIVLSEIESYDSTYTIAPPVAQTKKLLIEEQTGASCVNCPSASSFLKTKMSELPNRIVLVAVHSGFLTDKPSGGKQEFFNTESKQLSDFLDGDNVGKPAASFDRVEYNTPNYGKYNNPFTGGDWPGKISAQLAKAAPANIELESKQLSNGKIEVLARVIFTQNVNDKLALSMLVVENDIIDYQKSNGNPELITNYDFSHVFRRLVSPVSGFSVLDSLTTKSAGRVFEKKLQFDPKELEGNHPWILSNCKLVAFIHKAGSSKEVLQAEEVKLK